MSDEHEALSMEVVAGRIQHLVGLLGEHPDPELRRITFELLDLIDVLHREGLERIVALQGDRLPELAADPVIGHLLSVYGLLGEGDPITLVEEGLAEIRPYFQSHGGEMELLEVEGGVVRLRLLGACDSCPSSRVTLAQSVESAIRRRWPGLIRIEVENPDSRQWSPVHLEARRGGRG